MLLQGLSIGQTCGRVRVTFQLTSREYTAFRKASDKEMNVNTLGDRPGMIALPSPIGSSGMDKEDLKAAPSSTVQQNPGTILHLRFRSSMRGL
jgi:hypothetical protein